VKLLFDQNLSHRLVAALADLYPGSVHVREVGLRNADDAAVWDHVGHPPKVVWVRLGNCSTGQIEALLRRRHEALLGFEQNQEAAFLAVA
jgi:predicted nuclease of predicted toxin-antitoxin system